MAKNFRNNYISYVKDYNQDIVNVINMIAPLDISTNILR